MANARRSACERMRFSSATVDVCKFPGLKVGQSKLSGRNLLRSSTWKSPASRASEMNSQVSLPSWESDLRHTIYEYENVLAQFVCICDASRSRSGKLPTARGISISSAPLFSSLMAFGPKKAINTRCHCIRLSIQLSIKAQSCLSTSC